MHIAVDCASQMKEWNCRYPLHERAFFQWGCSPWVWFSQKKTLQEPGSHKLKLIYYFWIFISLTRQNLIAYGHLLMQLCSFICLVFFGEYKIFRLVFAVFGFFLSIFLILGLLFVMFSFDIHRLLKIFQSYLIVRGV